MKAMAGKVGRAALAAALAASVAAPAAAWAGEPGVEGSDTIEQDGGTASTQFSLVSAEDSDQISVTVPSVVTGAVNDDGSVTMPSDGAARFVNRSAVAVEVSSAVATAAGGFELATTEGIGEAQGEGALVALRIAPGPQGEGVEAAEMDGTLDDPSAWRMAAADEESDSDELPLAFRDGMTKNALELAKSGVRAFDVQWTVRIAE